MSCLARDCMQSKLIHGNIVALSRVPCISLPQNFWPSLPSSQSPIESPQFLPSLPSLHHHCCILSLPIFHRHHHMLVVFGRLSATLARPTLIIKLVTSLCHRHCLSKIDHHSCSSYPSSFCVLTYTVGYSLVMILVRGDNYEAWKGGQCDQALANIPHLWFSSNLSSPNLCCFGFFSNILIHFFLIENNIFIAFSNKRPSLWSDMTKNIIFCHEHSFSPTWQCVKYFQPNLENVSQMFTNGSYLQSDQCEATTYPGVGDRLVEVTRRKYGILGGTASVSPPHSSATILSIERETKLLLTMITIDSAW